MNNPWQDMDKNTQRRVSDVEFDMFWMVDGEGKFAFCIYSNLKNVKIKTLKLKGFLTQIKSDENGTKFFIALKNNNDWAIFAAICKDLINTAKTGKDDKIFTLIEKRLEKWHEFLQKHRGIEFPLEKQMGLFTELLFLKEISVQLGFEKAVLSWVGADFHKQDFVLDNEAIEVKSYISSKGPSIEISSANQLYTDKAKLYLITYALTHSENGKSCEDLILALEDELKNLPLILQNFQSKVLEYGYIQGLENKKYHFLVDSQMSFLISENFPKITPLQIPSQITSLKYSLNLLHCQEFKIDFINLRTKNG